MYKAIICTIQINRCSWIAKTYTNQINTAIKQIKEKKWKTVGGAGAWAGQARAWPSQARGAARQAPKRAAQPARGAKRAAQPSPGRRRPL